MNGKYTFFSVRNTVKMDGVPYRPSMCYPIRGAAMERAVMDLIAKGEARGFSEEVRFITGVPYPVKKPEAAAPAVAKVEGQKLTVPSSAAPRRGRKEA
jgi:2-hydroxychromene-2-carboxylate isomerase